MQEGADAGRIATEDDAAAGPAGAGLRPGGLLPDLRRRGALHRAAGLVPRLPALLGLPLDPARAGAGAGAGALLSGLAQARHPRILAGGARHLGQARARVPGLRGDAVLPRRAARRAGAGLPQRGSRGADLSRRELRSHRHPRRDGACEPPRRGLARDRADAQAGRRLSLHRADLQGQARDRAAGALPRRRQRRAYGRAGISRQPGERCRARSSPSITATISPS